MRITSINLLFAICIVFLSNSCTVGISNKILPAQGIYDGKFGNDNLILVVNELNEESASGYYVHNRNNLVEEDHYFSIGFRENKLFFISDEYEGALIGEMLENGFKGKLKLEKSKRSILFWKNSKIIHFTKRNEYAIPTLQRYKEEIFDQIEIKEDIVYGNAEGQWTETPYLDYPYVVILAKGMVNLFKAEKSLDLKLDLYQPKTDSNSIRPLILLVHGGGFYIGNKQAETEQILANKLTKLGYVVASIDYRMGFKLKANEIERSGYKAIQDVHAALRFLSNKADEYRIDPSQIYVAGTSAGAMAVLNTAFLDNNERPKSTFATRLQTDLGSIESSGNQLKNKFEIKAVCSMWGAVTDTCIIEKDEQIPVLSFHGNRDDIVPIDHSYPFKNPFRINRLFMNKIYGSQPIHQQLDRLNIENKLIVFDKKGHEPQLDNFKNVNDLVYFIMDEIIEFLYKQTTTKIELNEEVLVLESNARL
ncbi:MAG: alpha/beta hydrolase [Prolixibacteraceae bacterium]|jgi:predicted esterase|nr:alpha/beta hydrolase [Prolixibacteraceae bacterium]